jgi:hypothetical protein
MVQTIWREGWSGLSRNLTTDGKLHGEGNTKKSSLNVKVNLLKTKVLYLRVYDDDDDDDIVMTIPVGNTGLLLAQNSLNDPRIWITEGPLYLFTRPQKTVILTFTTVRISNAIYDGHLKYTVFKKVLIVSRRILQPDLQVSMQYYC